MVKKSFLILAVMATFSFSCHGMLKPGSVVQRFIQEFFSKGNLYKTNSILRYWNEDRTLLESFMYNAYISFFETSEDFYKDFQKFCEGAITFDDLKENSLFEDLKKTGFLVLFVNSHNQPVYNAKKVADIKSKMGVAIVEDPSYIADEEDDVEMRDKVCLGAGGRVHRDYSVSIEPVGCDEENKDGIELVDLDEKYFVGDMGIAGGYAVNSDVPEDYGRGPGNSDIAWDFISGPGRT